jgi:hypothetical protein
MKKIALVFAAAAMVAGFSTVSFADTSGSATATVLAKVNPNIGIKVNTATVDAGSVQTGDFSADIQFQVDANAQFINAFASASGLYKGADPSNTDVAPIPLNTAKGVAIVPTNGNQINNGPNNAAFTVAGDPIGAFPTTKTETITLESSQNGHFSQPINVRVFWNQNDPEKPQGQYTGKVGLYVLL